MIKKFDVYITPFNLDRTIHLYLPTSYFDSDKHYPVMYMYDGHNLFYDDDATYGKSWGLKEYLDQGKYEMIIVGIECNHEGNERLNEFCPYTTTNDFFGFIDGKGQILMDWVVQELKPYIDKHYRTLPERIHTCIGGSSMGGLMALYSVVHYNHIFSKAACLSSTIGFVKKELFDEIQQSSLHPDTKVYLDWGSKEARNQTVLAINTNDNLEIAHLLSTKKIQVYPRIVINGHHNEASWEKQIPIFMDYFFEK